MIRLLNLPTVSLLTLAFVLAIPQCMAQTNEAAKPAANRLTYLDESDPFYVGLNFPKLTTPQWVGEPGVDAVIILAVDDMKETPKYETFLRPILDRLKQIDGRAPVSIMCTAIDSLNDKLQSWLKEGLSLEVHTLTHPCPLLARSNFVAAVETYHGCVDLLNRVAGNRPVAFRMPCCDSINSPSPRFYAEIFNRTTPAGQFLTLDSSVMNIFTPKDAALPRELVVDPDGREKFRKYLPFPSFVTTIDDYPYPYVIGRLCWEFPAAVPSDWEAQHLQGTNNPATVADWKASIDATVIKQGTFTMIFHPHGWIRNDQLVELIDYAVNKYGKRIKFLNFREAQERLDKNLLSGQPLRSANGRDNGVRLMDLNNDGYLDVVIGNEQVRKTRVWNPKENTWTESDFPSQLITADKGVSRQDAGVKFGVVHPDGNATMLVRTETVSNAWHFDGAQWIEDKKLLSGLEVNGKPVLTRQGERDRGVRFRDVDKDGHCELLVGNESQNAVFSWSIEERTWKKQAFALPEGTPIVDAQGQDAGLRFVDVNEDGYDDVIFSNEQKYSLHLFIATPKPNLGWGRGWTFQARAGRADEPGAIPAIVRGAPYRNNGAWFHSKRLWVQNEETASLPDLVDRRSFVELVTGAESPPKSPAEALACIRVRPGFTVELVANEPLVIDPVAFDWGADGKLWVAEMRDYPLGVDGKGKAGGVIKFLEDTDGDGRYDKATVFLEGVNFPNGVMSWRKGVLVSAAPEIFYAEDTDGDGKADVRKTILVGFNEGNQQHRVNGFEYGLDNWVYAANGDSSGTIRSSATGQTANLRGHDLRFNPDTGVFDTVAGQTQFGRHRDDWGNWFGNNNPTWLWHYFLPENYLRRNPDLAVSTTRKVLANYPNSSRVFPISRPQQRFNWPEAVNSLTSANSATPYRDELFGPDFATSVFMSEPAQSVVHREILEPRGVTFTSHRPRDEQDREFLASTDNCFRPTMLKTGPDGALYISDIYRLVIEHPEYFPEELKRRPDLRAGDDKGHIYRVYPTDAKPRKIPRLDRLDTAGLVAALESPNGWERDMAQRLLVQAADKAAIKPLMNLLGSSSRPKTRLQALCTLDGLVALTPDILLKAFKDQQPEMREQAIRLSERFLKSASDGTSRDIGRVLIEMADDPSARVRYQLAFTLGEWNDPRAGRALVKLAKRDSADEHIQTAVMSSSTPRVGVMLETLLSGKETDQIPVDLLAHLFGLAAGSKDQESLTGSLTKLTLPLKRGYSSWQLVALSGFLDGLDRHNATLESLHKNGSAPLNKAIEKLGDLFNQARKSVDDAQASNEQRLLAMRLLGRSTSEREPDIERLGKLLRPQAEEVIQRAAFAALKRINLPNVAQVLLANWKSLAPGARLEALNILLSRSEWTQQFLAAVQAGTISAGEVGQVHQQRLITHSDQSIRDRAQRLFVARNANRQKVIKDYATVKELTGDTEKGAVLFRQSCIVCHRLKGEGNNIGPDLGTVADKSIDLLLVAILDPNQALEAKYVNYTAVIKDGREASGVIAAETPNSVTIRNAGGVEEVILRPDIKELKSSGVSLMPEGFENGLTPQDMADLIAYIRSD